jgi:uncharacterized protein YdiU (UPF0061 family)
MKFYKILSIISLTLQTSISINSSIIHTSTKFINNSFKNKVSFSLFQNFNKRKQYTLAMSQVDLSNLNFVNTNLKELPVDYSQIPGSRQVKNYIFSIVDPTPVKNPILISKSDSALALLGLNPSTLSPTDISTYFSGNSILPGSRPAAHAYSGHQFGNFAGQLGDGATMYLGEVLVPGQGQGQGQGGSPPIETKSELQLKGAGPTPFSRTADGRKVLRSSVNKN